MHSNLVMLPIAFAEGKSRQSEERTAIDYKSTEQQFTELLATDNLDKKLDTVAQIVNEFETALSAAISSAYQSDSGDDQAHTFLMRILYRINRLNLFWYDDLRNYSNERSLYLSKVREQIEEAWQEWALVQLGGNK